MNIMDYPNELAQWADKAGTPLAELQKEFDAEVEKLQANHPDWSETMLSTRATKIIYSTVKAMSRSKAKPYDLIVIGVSGTRDMNANKRKSLLQMYTNVDERETALIGVKGARVHVEIDDTTGEEKLTVVDDRQMIEFERNGQKQSFKNKNYGKSLEELHIRDIVAIGMQSFEDEELSVLRISAQRGSATVAPPIGVPIRVRLNKRDDGPGYMDMRTAAVTKWTAEIDVDWEFIDGLDLTTSEGLYELLGKLPSWMQVEDLGDGLDDWHEANADDWNRVCVIEGAATFVGAEPNSTGSYSLGIEEIGSFDMDADALQGFAPEELKDFIAFGPGTEYRALVRTNKSPAWDSETNRPVEADPDTGEQEMRVQFNYMMVAADPDATVVLDEIDEIDEIES